MADARGRVVDSSGWNTTDVWPVPVECLLNGMTPTDTLVFGGGHIIHHQFRQRFQSPLSQLTGSAQHLVSLPSHPIIESNTVAIDTDGQVEGGDNAQNSLCQSMPMNDGVLDESEESSDGDEDMSRHGPQMSLSHGLPEGSLVQVQCGDQVPVVQDNLVHAQHPMSTDGHCHHQKLGNDVTVMSHEQHALHDPPINPLFFQQQDQFEPPPVVDDSGSDPNTGFSVYGKLYYEREGRVVLHLKQWLEPSHQGSGMTFDPSDPLQGKSLLQGCVLCRLSAAQNHQDSYRNQKKDHRHTFRGVLFTFEECTIVELYPEQNHSINAHNGFNKPNDSQRKIIHQQQQNGQRLEIPSYLPVSDQLQQQQQQQHIEMNPLAPPPPPLEHKAPPQDNQAWWDEFESEEEGGCKEHDESSELSDDDGEGPPEPPSPIREQEIATVLVGNGEEPCFPEESPNYQADSPYLPQEAECEPEREDSALSHESPPLESLILIDRAPQPTVGTVGTVEREEDDNLATPQNQDHEEIHFSLVESEAEEIPVHAPSTPPPLKSRGRYECPCCDKRLHLKKSFKIHLDTEHASNPLRCNKCKKQFTEELLKVNCCAGLKSGQRTLTKKCETVKSEKPSKRRSSPSNPIGRNEKVGGAVGGASRFKREKKWRTPNKKPLPLTPPKKLKPFPCNLCPKSFSVQRRLDTHRLSHVNDNSSQCEKCGKRFARKDKLIRHMYVHSDEKMFGCSICSKRFSRRDKLADHLKSHGGPDGIHHCPLCKKEFLRPDILKQHVKLHGMGNKHQCTECLRFVTGKDRLEQHMARHEEAKAQGQPLLCPLCTKNFIQRQSLKAHIKKFHPSAHARLLSDLDFPSDQFELDGEQPEDELVANGEEKTVPVPKGKFPCSFCSKRFSKKSPLLRHVSKFHDEPQVRLDSDSEKAVSVPPIRKKAKKGRERSNGVVPKRERPCTPDPIPKSETPRPLISGSPPLEVRELSFTSAASQIVSPTASPRRITDDTLRMAAQGIDLGSAQQAQNGFHGAGTHIPITLATVSVNSNSAVAQNGILMGSHSLHQAHALLQHAHPLTHSLPGMAHPPGLHDHISHVSMSHHVGHAPQSMCSTPYVIYPHYYQ